MLYDNYKICNNYKSRLSVLEDNNKFLGDKYGYAQNILDIEKWYKRGDIDELERNKLLNYNDMITY